MLHIMLTSFLLFSGIFPLPAQAVDAFTAKCVTKDVTVCDVYLSSAIEEEDAYIELYKKIASLTAKDALVLHLAGRGGDADTIMRLINTIKESKALFIAMVEGPVMSAHALLAVQANKIYVAPNAYFLFHKAALSGGRTIQEACEKFHGKKDRGQDAQKQCENQLSFEMTNLNKLMAIYLKPVLTSDELVQLFDGHELLIEGSEIARRLSK